MELTAQPQTLVDLQVLFFPRACVVFDHRKRGGQVIQAGLAGVTRANRHSVGERHCQHAGESGPKHGKEIVVIAMIGFGAFPLLRRAAPDEAGKEIASRSGNRRLGFAIDQHFQPQIITVESGTIGLQLEPLHDPFAWPRDERRGLARLQSFDFARDAWFGIGFAVGAPAVLVATIIDCRQPAVGQDGLAGLESFDRHVGGKGHILDSIIRVLSVTENDLQVFGIG